MESMVHLNTPRHTLCSTTVSPITKLHKLLGLTEEQTRKFKEDYLKLIKTDKLEALFHLGDTKIQSIMDLQAPLSSNGISEQELKSASFQQVGRKKKSQFDLNKVGS